jgi:hypothetical protein
MPARPSLSAQDAKGLANRDGCPHHVAQVPVGDDEYVDAGASGEAEAGYSPMGGAILHEEK